MDHFDPTPEQAMFQDSAMRFTRETGTLENRQAASATAEGFSRENWRVYAELGWLALTVPADAGGLGGSFADLSALMQGLGPALILEPLVASSIQAAAIIDQAQDPVIRAAQLGQIASGDAIVTVANEEPWDIAGTEPMIASPVGDGYRLSGAKMMCWHAPAADRLLVTAPIAGQHDPAIFLVDAREQGVKIDAYRLIDSTRAGDVIFESVYVDRAALLIAGPRAVDALDRAQDRAILALSAEAVGMMQEVLHFTSDYLKARVQFGRELSKFQALQHRIAEMFVRYQDAVSALHHAVAAVDADASGPRRLAVSTAKVVIGEAARYVGAQGVQLHGAIGVTEEYRVGHYYRKFLMFDKMFGNSDFHLNRYEQLIGSNR